MSITDYLPSLLTNLLPSHGSVAYTVIVFAIVISVGVWLGRKKIFGISFGIACVLFMGILLSHFGFTVNDHILHFVKELGLILFVYTIGLQVGPGFFASFQQGGLKLNFLAIISAFCCVLTVVSIHFISGAQMPELVGVMSGAVTNTPGLGAAQQALQDALSASGKDADTIKSVMADVANGYAVTYPFGVLGIILVMICFKSFGKVNIETEKRLNVWKNNKGKSILDKVAIRVSNPDVFDKTVGSIHKTIGLDFVISRIKRGDVVSVANDNSMLQQGDEILLITESKNIDKFLKLIGEKTNISFVESDKTNIVSRRLNVTNKMAYIKKLGELNIQDKFDVTISRIFRAGIEFIPNYNSKLQFGDTITVVGSESRIKEIEKVFGNSKKKLEHPHIAELFFGITLGVLLGSLPIHIPGLTTPLKLGLAGGPLIVAILMSRYGGKFSVTHYVSHSANLMVREIGIVLFLACVGLGAGEKFVSTLTEGQGVTWMMYGVLITLIPVIAITLIGRFFYKLNFLEICGLISGTQTDPPALAFANDFTNSDDPSLTYASVYPLTTFLRIMVGQLLIVFFY